MPKGNHKPNQITPGESDQQTPTITMVKSDDEEDENTMETHNRMTAAGGNLLYHAMIAKKASITSNISETFSLTESIRGSSTSVASKMSKKISTSTTAFKRMSKRISMAFGYNRRSSESIPHGLYSDINFMPEELPKQKANEASGSLSLKLRYTFMFVEWLIFCSTMPYIFTLIGKLFEKLFS